MDLRSPREAVLFKLMVAAAALGGIALIGVVDFLSGVEYRTFPLYFLPLSLASWYLGETAALVGALIAACSWLFSNYLAGLRYAPSAWAFNFLMQGIVFAVVGSLIARVRYQMEMARQLSRTDPLTALLNSRAFYDEALRILALAQRYGRPLTLAYVDVDNFKNVNDRRGHAGGDDVLRRTAALLTRCTRASDLCARIGGDEFVLLLTDTGPEGAARTLERLRVLVAQAFRADAVPVTLSIGVAVFITPPADVDELVRHADAIMYAVKFSGKDRVHLEVIDQAVEGDSPAAKAAPGRMPGGRTRL